MSYRVESNPPTRGLSCSPSTRLSYKNPTEWRAILPLGGLAVVQVHASVSKILPSGEQSSHSGLSCSPSTRLSFKNPTEWRAILPLEGLAAVQVLAEVSKILPMGEQSSHSGALLQSKYSPKFQKSYRVESNPPTRGLSCSPSTRLSFKHPTEWRAILPLGGLAAVQVLA